jgi:hypothetical protein
MHLLRPGLSAVDEVKKRTPFPAPLDLERAVAEDDRRRRLGWGIYVSLTWSVSTLTRLATRHATGLSTQSARSAITYRHCRTAAHGWTRAHDAIIPADRESRFGLFREPPALQSRARGALVGRAIVAAFERSGVFHCCPYTVSVSIRLTAATNCFADTCTRLCLDAAAVQSLFSTPPSPSRYGLAFPPNIKQ